MSDVVKEKVPPAAEEKKPEAVQARTPHPTAKAKKAAGDKRRSAPKQAKPAPVLTELSPKTDLRQSADDFFIAVELPGLNRKDVSIKMNINETEIKGRKRRVKGLKKESDEIHEINDGIYIRKIVLPDTVQPKRARTTMKNGILTMVMPKKNYRKPIKIGVK